ncbi:MAG: hypothetical protein SWN10_22270, partial [Pseudomonadota bacterium]|nr:hypothetical protein [Pseudomonadota bacterium]
MKLDNARWMISAIPDAAILIDQAQTIIAANHTAAELFYTSSLSDLRLIYCAGGKTAHISRLFRCIEPLCASKSRKSAL